MHMFINEQEFQELLSKCNKMISDNYKLVSIISECNFGSYVFNLDRVIFTDSYIKRKFKDMRAFDEATSIILLNRILKTGLQAHGSIQLENSKNLQIAKSSIVRYDGDEVPCYYEDEDYIYYWEPTKHQYNIDKHDVDLTQVIDWFNFSYPNIYYIDTIRDELHLNDKVYLCIDGISRIETNYLRFLFELYDDNNHYNLIKIAYNVRYSETDDKYVIKFTSAYDNVKVPSNLKTKVERIYRKVIKGDLDFEEGAKMKFKCRKTGEIVDLSENADHLTLNDVRGYVGFDMEAKMKKSRLIHEWNLKRYDFDKIFSYDDIMPDGAWPGYYNYRVTTKEEQARMAKYYEKNRLVFNEQLDRKRAMNSNFIEIYQEEFNYAKDAITYGAPQNIVRYWMRKLYGDKVLDLLPEEDPQDAIDDPDLRNWLF